MNTELMTWVGIVLCIAHSAMFSGLNLAFFSLGRLRLEVEAEAGGAEAAKVLALRQNPNLLLTTILFGNVAINVLLTLLSESLLAGVAAFLFSTLVITAFGEIAPQAYFSRNALRVASFFSPIFRVYRVLLFPVAGPVAWVLDRWLGREGLSYFREREMRHLIRRHVDAHEAEIDRIEGLGALNFLAIDDLPVAQEGMPLDPASVVHVPFSGGSPQFPAYRPTRDDAFLSALHASRQKWVVLVDDQKEPQLVLDADGFLRETLFSSEVVDPVPYCHRPIVVRDPSEALGWVMSRWNLGSDPSSSAVIDTDLVLLWGDSKRVITGADVLGRLLMGIAAPT